MSKAATAPQLDRDDLLRRLRLEQLVASISTEFLRLKTHDIDRGIGHALQRIGKFAGLQRAGIIRFPDAAPSRFQLTHEWYQSELSALAPLVQDLTLAPEVFADHPVRIGETMTIGADESAPAAEVLMALGLASIIIHPIVGENGVAGVVAFGWEDQKNVHPEDSATLLKLLGTMVSNFERRQRVEAARIENQSQFDSLMSSKVVGIILARTDGTIVDINQVAAERIELDPQQVARGEARWTDYLVAPNASMYQEPLQELQRQGFTTPRETYFRHADGSHFPVLISMTDLGTEDGQFLAMLVDLSERDQIEAELRYRSEFDRLVAALSRGFVHPPATQLDSAINDALAQIGQFTEVDRCRVFLIDPEAEAAVLAHRWVHPDKPDSVGFASFPLETFPWCRQIMERGLTVEIGDGDLPEAAARDREVLRSHDVRSFLGLPMMQEGRLMGFSTFVTIDEPKQWPQETIELVRLLVDILAHAMERKRIDDETRELTRTLEENVRLRTLELELNNQELASFSYAVSHDLRAPLRSIDGYSKILLDEHGANLDDNGRELLQRVRAATKRMHELIDALLQLSNLSSTSISWSQVDLAADARATANRLLASDPDREVEFIIPPTLPIVGEAGLLSVALENLLANAWKFTAKHSRATIEVGCFDENGETVYFVRDDGAGFNPEFSSKLFGTFQRLHRVSEFEGHGIGLATVGRIVQLHSGRVWAEGEVEKGAVFFFTVGSPG